MKRLAMVLLAAAVSLAAKDLRMFIHFSPKLQMHGRRHDDMVTLHCDGRRIICRCKPSDVRERNWLAATPRDTCSAMYLEVTYVDGIGKVLMLTREECHDGEESCARGIAYLIRGNGEWEKGVFARMTLGWGDSDSRIWGGYSFATPRWDRPRSLDSLRSLDQEDEAETWTGKNGK